jgi:AraC-like DNA-binding protein
VDVDALSLILRSLRLHSAVASLVHATGRWAISSPELHRTLVFHGVVAGRCQIQQEASPEPLALEAGDIVFLAHGGAHRIASDSRAPVVPFHELPVRMAGSVPIATYGSAGAETRIVCGKCTLDHPAARSVLDLLPSMLAPPPLDETRRQWVSATLALLEQEVLEQGPAARVTSLTDSLFVHLVAGVAHGMSFPRAGLLAATRDPQIGRALALVHGDPSAGWSAATLAAKVSMSRTRFFDRFTELVGEPPAKYIARWRVLSAADLLRDTSLSTQQIAERVGYSTEDALARAFKRHMGQRLGQYRRGGAALN